MAKQKNKINVMVYSIRHSFITTVNNSRFIVLLAIVITTVFLNTVLNAKESKLPIDVPVTGKHYPNAKLFDEVMLKYREKIGCTAATLAISRKGKLLLRHGYGWSDREMTIPTDPDTMIGIASCDKPITSAAIRRLAKQKSFDLDAKLFELLNIKPQGPIVDERVKNITIDHVLGHKAGWGKNPRRPAVKTAIKDGFKKPVPIEVLLGFIMTFPLVDEPGTEKKYCNFGYDTLRHVVEKFSSKTYIKYYCTSLLGFPSVKEMHGPGHPLNQSDPPLVWNDASGGPVSASARVLCRFMDRYWLTGKPRRKGNPYWVMYGSLNGSTALMIWRSDGYNIAALFNGRNKKAGHGEINKELQSIIDRIEK